MPLEADAVEMVWNALQAEIQRVSRDVQQMRVQYERAGVADGIPAYTLATAPLAADGGLANGTSYITVAWISNGRKSGEGAGSGTGVLAVYQSSTNQWLRLTDYTAVVV